MRRLILFNMLSLDGYIARADGSLDWHRTDAEFSDFAVEQLAEAGGLVFGRKTYELMAGFWPTPAGLEGDPLVAEAMNRLPKYVASRTLREAPWNNSVLLRGDAAAEIAALKRQTGRDLFLFGSADLGASLIQAGLIDEFRLMLNPLVIGGGIPQFREQPLHLSLARTRPFANGNILLVYEPAQEGAHG